ncbi:carbamoyltransferase HypF [Mariprofundus ferrooxydans]|nr:carbamoyltransferase HypF [Mariprofundus ferrooxydans]
MEIRVRGVVQGVGFRPYIAGLAKDKKLFGRVWNDAQGVLIQVWGSADSLEAFVPAITLQPPPLAKIQSVHVITLSEPCGRMNFEIIASQSGQTATGVAADAAMCAACRDELFDPNNRHYRYPFTNCTHCGPRLSIIRAVPYDRSHTSMASFQMCGACLAEYSDQADRRFHAQPNACPDCGPEIQLLDVQGAVVTDHDLIATAAGWLRAGKVLAIKGIGGIHLACDASNEVAVSRLRQRKRRYHKPFALMGRDTNQIQHYAELSEQEKSLLEGVQAPVVILVSKHHAGLAASIAPAQRTVGFMLPYTPLHQLLLQALDAPIVLTSGNLSDEPQCIDNDDALRRLQELVDGYLLHNRDIVNRLDDSVVRMMAGQGRLLRRARGYAPSPLLLPEGFEQAAATLAMGGELKNTFCMLAGGQAIVSQHMGDLEHAAVHNDYRNNLQLYRQLYDFKPEVIAVDKHPGYFSTQWGGSMAVSEQCRLVEIQHHHAHVAACMAEHGLSLDSQVLGVALDGLGMGEHDQLWGGEFLLASYTACRRIGSIQPVAMIGAAKAMYEPWRNTYAQLYACGWDHIAREFSELDVVKMLSEKPLHTIDRMIEQALNSPLASSTGRLFDAVAAALGICVQSADFEGQAAILLEVLATDEFDNQRLSAYPVVTKMSVDGLPVLMWQPMWMALLQDLQQGVGKAIIAARFHHALIHAVSDLAIDLSDQHGVQQIVLTGGVFQNRLLLEGVQQCIARRGLQVLVAADYPVNDGGLSLGQAVIAGAQSLSPSVDD